MSASLSRCLACLAFLVVSLPAQALFHFFTINEMYSNADGTVQFVELTALAGSQQFLAGHTIKATSGAATNTFTFLNNLPGDTTGKKFLIGTQGFAALGVVTPDYIVPNGFFFLPGGTMTYAEIYDIWNYGPVPSDGLLSLNRDGTTAVNSATNFAGDSGHAPLVSNIPRLAGISTRMGVLTGDNVLIGGFIIGGSAPKTVVVNARGPSLTGQGVAGAIANPTLTLVPASGTPITNDDWGSAPNAATIQSLGLAPPNTLESSILATLNPGAYTAIVSGAGGTTGVGIVEVFEVDHPEIPTIGISTRGQVQTGDNVMIGGFIIQGSAAQTVVIRARGPSLASQGVTNPLANPMLQVFQGATMILSNDNWATDANAGLLLASGFAPTDSLESAILVTLDPGAYTAIVSGVGGTTGVALVEVYKQ